jgi:hypothetical protein
VRQQAAQAARLAEFDIVVDRMIVPESIWKAAKCASVTVRLGLRKTSPTFKSANVRCSVTLNVFGSNPTPPALCLPQRMAS